MQTILSCAHGELVLIALGQTATALAYDLSEKGIRSLDVGHIDIEYEWLKNGVVERTYVPGKHTAELPDVESSICSQNDHEYYNSIIAEIHM